MANSLLKKSMISSAVALALSVSAVSSFAVQGVKFDPTGGGLGGIQVKSFAWALNTYMADNIFTNGTGTSFAGSATGTQIDADGATHTSQARLVGQGQMSGTYTDPAGVSQTNGLFGNFTYEFSIPVDTGITATTTLNSTGSEAKFGPVDTSIAANAAADPFGLNNYFRLYFTPTAPNSTTGAGFGNSEGGVYVGTQTLILAGKLSMKSGKASQTEDGLFDISNGAGGTTTQGANAIKTVTIADSSINLNIDVCSTAEAAVASGDTVCQGGVAGFVDTRFFRSSISAMSIDLTTNPDANFGAGIVDPFTAYPVPMKVNNILPNFGDPLAGPIVVNNFTCDGGTPRCDAYYQGQAGVSTVFDTFAPEPGSMALLGLGLAALGVRLRRKS